MFVLHNLFPVLSLTSLSSFIFLSKPPKVSNAIKVTIMPMACTSLPPTPSPEITRCEALATHSSYETKPKTHKVRVILYSYIVIFFHLTPPSSVFTFDFSLSQERFVLDYSFLLLQHFLPPSSLFI